MNEISDSASENMLIQTVMNFIRPFTTADINTYINKGIIPRLELISEGAQGIPQPLRLLMRTTYIKYVDKFTIQQFDKGVQMFRPDLIPLFTTKRGSVWRELFFKKLHNWVKTL